MSDAMPTPTTVETTVQWHACTAILPDADQTVLMYHPELDEPIGLGWWDGETWRAAESGWALDRECVLWWADFPEPPGERAAGANAKLCGPGREEQR